MNPNRIPGAILLVVGVLLLFFGLRATDSLGETVTEGLTGKYSAQTIWLIVGGAAATLAGAMMAFFSGRRAPA